MDSLVRGSLAHGRELVRWALSFSDVSDPERQTKLMVQLGTITLQKNSDLMDLRMHMHELWDTWVLIAGNSERNEQRARRVAARE